MFDVWLTTPSKRSYHTAAVLMLASVVQVFAPDSNASEVYRWTDDNGIVNYAERAPNRPGVERINTNPNGTSTRFALNTATPNTEPAATGDSTDANLAANNELKQQIAAQRETRLAEIAKTKAENCALARKQFDELTQYARLRIADETGEFRIVSDQERAERLDTVEARILENCTG